MPIVNPSTFAPADNTLLGLLSAPSGSSLVGFSHANAYAQGTTGLALQGYVNIKNAPYNAVGDGVTDDTAAINNALAAVTDGGTLHVPVGTYLTSGGHIRATRINIEGDGWASIFKVAAAVGSSTDIFIFKPADANVVAGIRLQDFYIQPVSGTPGRYGINIDGTNGPVSNFVLDNVRIDELGNYSLAVTNASGLTTGSPFSTTVTNQSYLAGGINLTDAGDSITLENSTFTGSRDVKIGQIGAAGSNGGAHGFVQFNCNVTTLGGIVVTNAWQGMIIGGNIEATAASTNANNALIDIQGNASANVQNFKIIGAYLGANSAYVADTVRIGKCKGTEIERCYAVQGSGVIYRITANADRTNFSMNRHAPDSAASSFLADLGTNTSGKWKNHATGVVSHYGTQDFTNASGVTGVTISSTQVKVNPTNGIIGASSGDPSATAMDTGISRLQAGEFGIGTGAFGSSAGHIVQTGGIDLGNFQVKRVIATRGTDLVAGDFALSAGWGTTAAVSAVIGTDQAWRITVTSAGTGQGASPTITLTFKDGTWTTAPISVSQMTGGTGTLTQITETPTATTNVLTFVGTPVATFTYIISSMMYGT